MEIIKNFRTELLAEFEKKRRFLINRLSDEWLWLMDFGSASMALSFKNRCLIGLQQGWESPIKDRQIEEFKDRTLIELIPYARHWLLGEQLRGNNEN